MNENRQRTLSLLISAVSTAVGAYALYTMYDIIIRQPGANSAKKRAELADRLGKPVASLGKLSSHEVSIADDVIRCSEIKESFADIGGMDSQLEEIFDNVILPVKHWQQIKASGQQLTCPSGVLLYGKPGTGKTLTAKAIARECGATFIGMKASTILDKYLGESEQRVSALFSLARKLAPTVVFIDEIDTLLKTREHMGSAGAMINTTLGMFMSEWDGLSSGTVASCGNGPVVIIGATNRPDDIDAAFRRRMPLSIQTFAPDHKGRKAILQIFLANEKECSSVDIDLVATEIEGFTGAQIKELCRLVSLCRLKSAVSRTVTSSSVATGGINKDSVSGGVNIDMEVLKQPLTNEHFATAINKMKSAGENVSDFTTGIQGRERERIAAEFRASILKKLSEAGSN